MREQGKELALAYMWRIHVETGPRRLEEAIAQCRFIVGEGRLLHVGGGQHRLSIEEWGVQPKKTILSKN